MARALYDFTGDPAVRQLTFKKNDVIKVTHQYENGWWAGEINGKIGYLPSTYIKLEAAGSPAPPTNSLARTAPPTIGGAAKPSPATSPAVVRPTPPAKPAPERTPFGMTSVTSNNPVPVQQPVKPAPPVTGPPTRQVTSPAPVQLASTSVISKPPPIVSKPPPVTSKPPPVTSKPPPAAQKPLPPAKPQPAIPSQPQQSQQPQNRNVPTLGKGWSAAAPGSEVNEADFNELDSLIKSLQDEVLDLKKLL